MKDKKIDNNDVVLDSSPEMLDDSVVAEENTAEAIKKLKEKLKKAEAERLEFLTGWQRDKAEFINARKRDVVERNEFTKFANERLIEELLPVLESFDMAMSNKEVWEKADKNWRTGVEYIYSQLLKVLTDFGVKEINPIGEKFDHAKHEATSYEVVTDESKVDTIIGVVKKGYSLNEKVLRAPKVVVGEMKK